MTTDPDRALFDSLIVSSEEDPDRKLFDSLPVPEPDRITVGERARLRVEQETGEKAEGGWDTARGVLGSVTGANVGRKIDAQRREAELGRLTEASDDEINSFIGTSGLSKWAKSLKPEDAAAIDQIVKTTDDPQVRAAAVRKLANDTLAGMTERKQAASERLETGFQPWHSRAVSYTVENAGYMLPFAGGGKIAAAGKLTGIAKHATKAALPLLRSGVATYKDLTADTYDVDDEGNVFVASEGDSGGKAALKAAANAGREVAIEMAGGPALGWVFGKAAGKFVSSGMKNSMRAAVRRMNDTDAGRAVLGAARAYRKISEHTQFHGFFGEMFEEELDLVTGVFGLDKKASENKGIREASAEYWGDAKKLETHAEIALGLLGTFALHGGISTVQSLKAEKSRTRAVDNALRMANVSDETIAGMNAKEKDYLYEVFIQREMEPEKAAKIMRRLGGRLSAAADEITEQEGYRFDADRDGIKPNFKIPGDIADDGQVHIDPASGIGLASAGDGRVTMYDPEGGKAEFASVSDAVEAAKQRSVELQVLGNRRANKMKFVGNAAQRLAGNLDIDVFDSVTGLVQAHPELRENPNFDPRSPGVRMPGGKIALVLDNIKSPQGALRTIMHEAGIHEGLRKTLGSKEAVEDFAKNVGGVTAEELEARSKKLGYRGDKALLVEEGLAHAYENRTADPSTYQDAVSWLRGHLRKVNPKLSYSDSEIEVLMWEAQQSVMGEGGAARRVEVDAGAMEAAGREVAEGYQRRDGERREAEEQSAYERKMMEIEESYTPKAPVSAQSTAVDLNAESQRRMAEDPQAWIESLRAAKGDIGKAALIYDGVREDAAGTSEAETKTAAAETSPAGAVRETLAAESPAPADSAKAQPPSPAPVVDEIQADWDARRKAAGMSDEAPAADRATRHRVFEGGSPIRVSNPKALRATDQTKAYRLTSQAQVDDMLASGGVRAREGKMKGGHSGEVHWSAGHETLGYNPRDGAYVIETSRGALNGRAGILPNSDVRLWRSENGTWTDVSSILAPTPQAEQEATTAAEEKRPDAAPFEVEGLKFNGVQRIEGMEDHQVWTDTATGGTFFMPGDADKAAVEAHRDGSRKKFDDDKKPAPAKPVESKQDAMRKRGKDVPTEDVSAPDKKAPELMTPDELKNAWADGHGSVNADMWRGVDHDNARKAVASTEEEMEDIRSGKLYSGNIKAWHLSHIGDAFSDKRPVSAAAVDAYKIKLPDGYVRSGDLYVFKPSGLAQGDKTPAVAVKAGISTTPVEKALRQNLLDDLRKEVSAVNANNGKGSTALVRKMNYVETHNLRGIWETYPELVRKHISRPIVAYFIPEVSDDKGVWQKDADAIKSEPSKPAKPTAKPTEADAKRERAEFDAAVKAKFWATGTNRMRADKAKAIKDGAELKRIGGEFERMWLAEKAKADRMKAAGKVNALAEAVGMAEDDTGKNEGNTPVSAPRNALSDETASKDAVEGEKKHDNAQEVTAAEKEKYFGAKPSGPHENAIAANLAYMKSYRGEWEAMPINGMALVDDERGFKQEMPEYDFSEYQKEGYKDAPSLYASGNTGSDIACEWCSHPIKNVYWLVNKKRKWLMKCGSECIKDFGESTGLEIVKKVEQDKADDALRSLVRMRSGLSGAFRYTRDVGYGRTETTWGYGKGNDAAKLFDKIGKMLGQTDVKSDQAAKTRWWRKHGESITEIIQQAEALIASDEAKQSTARKARNAMGSFTAQLRRDSLAEYEKRQASKVLATLSGLHESLDAALVEAVSFTVPSGYKKTGGMYEFQSATPAVGASGASGTVQDSLKVGQEPATAQTKNRQSTDKVEPEWNPAQLKAFAIIAKQGGDAYNFAGPRNLSTRKGLLEAITGQKVLSAKAGVHELKARLEELSGKKHDEDIKSWLEDQVSREPPASPSSAVKVETEPDGDMTVSVPKADKSSIKPKEQKKFLLAEIDKALEMAPDNAEAFPRTKEAEEAQADYLGIVAENYPLENKPSMPYNANDEQKAKHADKVLLYETKAGNKLDPLFEKYGTPEMSPESKGYLNIDGTMSGVSPSTRYPIETRYGYLEAELNGLRGDKYPTVTIEVPGDGQFTVINDKAHLSAFREKAKKFPASPYSAPSAEKKPTPEPHAPVRLGRTVNFDAMTAEIKALLQPFASKDQTRKLILNPHWNGAAGEAVATDGRRLAVMIGKKNAKPKKDDSGYPNYTQVIPGYKKGKVPNPDPADALAVKVDSAKLARKLTQALSVYKDVDKAAPTVNLWLTADGTLEVSTDVVDTGSYSSLREEGDGFLIGIYNPEYLMDALTFLRKTGNETPVMYASGRGSPMIMAGKSEYVVQMPLRLDSSGRANDTHVEDYAKWKAGQDGALDRKGRTPEQVESLKKMAAAVKAATANANTPAQAVRIIPYKDVPSSKIKNMEAMPRGTGARYLEVTEGENGDWVAKQWRRTPVTSGNRSALLDFDAPAGLNVADDEIDRVARNEERREARREDGDAMFRRAEPVFFSQLRRTLEAKMPNRMTVMALRGMIDPAKGSGVKADEIEWTGLKDFLDAKNPGDYVTKAEVLEAVRDVEIQEVVKADWTNNRESMYAAIRPISENVWSLPGDSQDFQIRRTADGYEVHRLQKVPVPTNYDEYDTLLATRGDLHGAKEFVSIEASHDARAVGETKFSQYQLPGGKNYRELLLTLPTRGMGDDLDAAAIRQFGRPYLELDDAAQRAQIDAGVASGVPIFQSGHFSEPNILAHVRFNERTAANGDKTLFLEEVQSDWHQKGREEGYAPRTLLTELPPEYSVIEEPSADGMNYSVRKGNSIYGLRSPIREQAVKSALEELNGQLRVANDGVVPDAPFKDTSKGWARLAFKRMLRWAAENGFDRVAWTTGEQQAERYDLSKQVDKLILMPSGDGYAITGVKGGVEHSLGTHSKSRLSDVIGKEAASKVAAWDGNPNYIVLDGVDLKVGGQGMRTFYDQILPSIANDLGKKFGARAEDAEIVLNPSVLVKVTPVDVGTAVDNGNGFYLGTKGSGWDSVHSLPVTPAMRDSVMQGQPMFRRVTPEQDKAYLDAVAKGDTATARRMVYEAAKAAGELLYRSEQKKIKNPGVGAVFYTTDESYAKLYHGEERTLKTAFMPSDLVDIRLPEGRALVRDWLTRQITRIEEKQDDGHIFGISTPLRDARRFLDSGDSPQAIGSAMANIGDAIAKERGLEGIVVGLAEKTFLDDTGRAAMTMTEHLRNDGEDFSVAFRVPPSSDPVTYDDAGNVIPLSERFNEANDDTRFRRVGIPVNGPRYTTTHTEAKPGALVARFTELHDAFRTKQQDYMLPAVRLYERVQRKAKLRDVPRDQDFIHKQRVHASVLGAKSKDIDRRFVDPMTEEIQKAGMTFEELHEYAAAVHAPFFNRMIEARRKNMSMPPSEMAALMFGEGLADGVDAEYLAEIIDNVEDGWAGQGLSDENAAKIVSDFEAKRGFANLKNAHDLLMAMNRNALETRVNAGLMSRAQADTLLALSPFYVPLHVAKEEEEGGVSGGGRNLGGREFKRAVGHFGKENVNSVAQSIIQAYQAEDRALENEARRALADFLEANPDDSQYVITGHAPKKAVTVKDKDGTLRVVSVPRQDWGMKKEHPVVTFKRDGARMFIEFRGERKMAVTHAVKGDNVIRSEFLSFLNNNVMRFFKVTRTALNPEFFIPNISADFGDAMVNLTADGLNRVRDDVIKQMPHAWKIIFEYNRGHGALEGKRRSRGMAEAERFLKEAVANGMMFDSKFYNDTDDVMKDLEKRLQKRVGGKTNPMSWLSPREDLDTAGLPWMLAQIDRLNSVGEMGTRLSIYMSARKNGMGVEQAVELARNVTVDFHRKGEWTPVTNTLYAFSNVGIQATYRMGKALLTSKSGHRVAGGLFAAGFLSGLIGALLKGDDDDEENGYGKLEEWWKQGGLVLPNPFTGNWVRLRLRGIPAAIIYAGMRTADTLTGYASPMEAAVSSTVGFVDSSFNFLGTSGSIAQLLMPTLADPFIQSAENKDAFGNRIAPASFNKSKPDSEQYRKGTSKGFVNMSRLLNSMSGGDRFTAGGVDVSPETLRHWTDFVGGGSLKFVTRSMSAVESALRGEEMESSQIPIVRSFVFSPSDENRQNSRYYEAVNEFEDARYRLKGYTDARDRERKSELIAAHPYVRSGTADRLLSYSNRIKKLRELEERTEDAARRKELAARRLELQTKYIKLMRVD